MDITKEAIAQLAKEQVEKIKEESNGIDCFGRFFTWQELEKALISFIEDKFDKELYPQDLDKWEFGDLPFEPTLKNKKNLWNKLSHHVQCIAKAHGCSDTEFRDEAFDEAVKTVLHFSTCGEYYRSCTFIDCFQGHIYIPID